MRKWLLGLIIGALTVMAGTVFAEDVKSYVLKEAAYEIIVNGKTYQAEELPVLNYAGNTYVPLRAVGQMLDADVKWNSQLHRVEIGKAPERNSPPDETTDSDLIKEIEEENEVFRNILLSGSNGEYVIQGETKASNQVFYYAISDGHDYLAEDMHRLNEMTNEWQPFELRIQLSKEDLPLNGTLMIELYDGLDEDGFRTGMLFVPLERFVPKDVND